MKEKRRTDRQAQRNGEGKKKKKRKKKKQEKNIKLERNIVSEYPSIE